MIFFKEMKESCTSIYAVIAYLAQELRIPFSKHICVYKFIEVFMSRVNEILKKYGILYVIITHCFLMQDKYQFDLTERNFKGAKKL